MPTGNLYAQTATEWIFVARSLAQTANGQDLALRCMAHATMQAEDVNDWVIAAIAWQADFGDSDLARECLEKAELIAAEAGEGWDDIADAWAGMKNLRKVVDICREWHEPMPWSRIDEIKSQGPLPPGTSVLDWIEPGETERAPHQAIENANAAMQGGSTVEAVRYLIDAENLADNTRGYLTVAASWQRWFPELPEARETMEKAETAVDTTNDWIQIALKWKEDFQDYDEAVVCMRAAESRPDYLGPSSATVEQWELILRVWKEDFQDLDNFRRALNMAFSELESFEEATLMVIGELDAHDLIEKATLVDLGTLQERALSRVAAWDKNHLSVHRQGCPAGHYRFDLSEAKKATVFLTSDVDNRLYLIKGETLNGSAIAIGQCDEEPDDVAVSVIDINLDPGNYVLEATTDQGSEPGLFHLQIYLSDEGSA